MSNKELDAAMDLARETKRNADTIRTVICSLQLALAELDILRPLHYGCDDSRGDRDPVKLGGEAEHYVKEELACLPLAIDALEKEWRKVTDEHETACAKVRELDPRET